MRMVPLSLLLVGILVNFTGALLPPESLKKISEEGRKYITEQFENALNGVKQMKQLMDQTGEEHQKILRTLEETKKSKEDALKQALESEQQLSETQEICNDTMLALWEECKPCLKQTCVRFYSKTCRSGSGLVGRQLEDFLNRSSPFAIWVNGERIDTLNKQNEQQHMALEDIEDGYSIVEDSVHELFQDSIKAFDHMKPLFSRPFNGFSFPQWEPFPFQRISPPVSAMRIRKQRSPLFEPFFTSNFDSLFKAAQKMMEKHRQMIQQGPRFDGMGNATDDKMVCRELRRNTGSCLKMKDKCEFETESEKKSLKWENRQKKKMFCPLVATLIPLLYQWRDPWFPPRLNSKHVGGVYLHYIGINGTGGLQKKMRLFGNFSVQLTGFHNDTAFVAQSSCLFCLFILQGTFTCILLYVRSSNGTFAFSVV